MHPEQVFSGENVSGRFPEVVDSTTGRTNTVATDTHQPLSIRATRPNLVLRPSTARRPVKPPTLCGAGPRWPSPATDRPAGVASRCPSPPPS